MSGDSADKAARATKEAKAHDLRSRELLMHGTKPEPVIQLANDIAENGPSADPVEGLPRIQKRRELYAISNLILRGILPKVDQWIHENPGLVPEYYDEITDVRDLFKTIPIAEAAARFHEVARTGEGKLVFPDFGYGRILLKYLIDWETKRDEFSAEDRAIYDRFVAIIDKYRPTDVRGLRPYPASCFIWRGGNTASEFPWNIAKIIPVRWYQVTGKTMTPDEFKDTMNNIGMMLINQSSMRLERFDLLERAMHFDGAQKATFWQEVENRAEFITFVPQGTGMRIAFDNTKLEEWLARNPPREQEEDAIAIGCPGRDVRTPSANPAKNGELVDPMTTAYEFNAPFAEEFFMPVLEEYTNRYIGYTENPDPSPKEMSG